MNKAPVKRRYAALFIFILKWALPALSQPYVDLLNTSAQVVPTTYNDALKSKNLTTNYFVNLMAPIRLDSNNTIIIRFYGENLQSSISNSLYSKSYSVYSAILPIGYQYQTKNKKWKLAGLAMPKLSSDFKDKLSGYDFQMGAYALLTFQKSKTLAFKLGGFYNAEYFDKYYFWPLFSVDWKVSNRWQMYGVLPQFYRIEYAAIKKKIYTGLAFKAYTRSYRLSSAYNHDYVKNYEAHIKLFVDFYLKNNFVLFAEAGHTLFYSPKEYNQNNILANNAGVFSPINSGFLFNAGLAYRIRFDY
ncbi:MAG: hypothetical protein JST67_05340 [Bacteroidetes bacterium]|nr:hypothetical protein [Bacteroidota bacterium]